MTTRPTVLVVDDERSVLEVCNRALLSFGCIPITAATAGEALALVDDRVTPLQAAVVDIVLPDMSGFELVGILRDRALVEHFVCTSGFPPGYIPAPYRGSIEDCYFLQKPFTPRQLRAILYEAWGLPAA